MLFRSLGGSVIYGFYVAILRRRPMMHPLSFVAVTFALGALMILPLMLREHMAGQVIVWGVGAGASILYIMVFPSLLAYLCFNRGVELIGPGRAGQALHLVPVFGTVLSVLLLGEAFQLFHAVGIALIAGGILLASLGVRR